MPRPRKDPRVDRLVSSYDAPHRAVGEALRAAIRRAAPELVETVWMGTPAYVGRKPVLYLAEYSDHVNLGFHRGALLRDPDHLLEGTGKGLRHVKVFRTGQARDPRLARLIREAAAQDAA